MPLCRHFCQLNSGQAIFLIFFVVIKVKHQFFLSRLERRVLKSQACLCINRPFAHHSSPCYPPSCELTPHWTPAAWGPSDRSRGLMGLAFRPAAPRHIKPLQTSAFTNEPGRAQRTRLYARVRPPPPTHPFTHGDQLMSV